MDSDEQLSKLEEKYDGYTVYDRDGEKIGKVDDLFVDETDREEYIGVKMGLFGLSGTTLIPTEVARVDDQDRSIRVSESKDRVKDAPSYKNDDEVTDDLEDRVRGYYGLERGESSAERGSYGQSSGRSDDDSAMEGASRGSADREEYRGEGEDRGAVEEGDTEQGERRDHEASPGDMERGERQGPDDSAGDMERGELEPRGESEMQESTGSSDEEFSREEGGVHTRVRRRSRNQESFFEEEEEEERFSR